MQKKEKDLHCEINKVPPLSFERKQGVLNLRVSSFKFYFNSSITTKAHVTTDQPVCNS